MLKEAARVSEIALGEVINAVRPGVTELQIVGVAKSAIYKNGAEYHAKPQYIFSGTNTRHAVARASHRSFKEGEMITLGVAAEVGGYAGTVDRPVCLGKMPSDMRRVVQGGLDAHIKTLEWVKAGVPKKEVVDKYYAYLTDKGLGENILYGPCTAQG